MLKIYIDIDGILLTNRKANVSEGAEDFISYVTGNFDCYWLTTHCKGNIETVILYLEKYFSEDTLFALKKIKPTNWDTLKTEAIDFSSPFVWLDDYPMEAEKNILERANVLNNLIVVDLNRPNELLRIIKLLAKILK